MVRALNLCLFAHIERSEHSGWLPFWVSSESSTADVWLCLCLVARPERLMLSTVVIIEPISS